MYENNRQPGPSLEELYYYFDGIACNKGDREEVGRRSKRITTIKDKLMILDRYNFDGAMQAIEGVIHGAFERISEENAADVREPNDQTQLGVELYNRVAPGGVTGAEEAKSISAV